MKVKADKFIIEDLDQQDLRGIAEACNFYNAFSEKILGTSGCTWIGSWQFLGAGKLDDDVWAEFTQKVEEAKEKYDWTKFKTECLIEEPQWESQKETKND